MAFRDVETDEVKSRCRRIGACEHHAPDMTAFDGNPLAIRDVEGNRNGNSKPKRLAILGLAGDIVFHEVEVVVLKSEFKHGRRNGIKAMDRRQRL